MSVVIAMGATLVLAGVPSANGVATHAELTGQSELLVAMNAERAKHGVAPLRISRILAGPARRHSAYLARIGQLDHNGVDGRPFYVRLHKAGFSQRRVVGENLGMTSGCATNVSRAIVRMWLGSPGHRANLLSKRFKVVGLAVVAAPDCSNTVYATDFGG